MHDAAPTTRDAILTTACQVFLRKGYQGAGLREIAKEAGVTTGALYGYFKNKEELFDALVGGPYQHLLDLYREILHRFNSLPPEEQLANMEHHTAQGMEVMVDYMYENYTAFKLILCKSEGTRYHDLIHEMAELDVAATHDFAQTSADLGSPTSPVNPTLEHMLTSGMFTAFFQLVIHDVPREEVDEYTHQLLTFYAAGWERLMGL